MSPVDLVVMNGRVATPCSLRSCAVAAKDGKLSWIGSNSNAPSARRVIDASGLIVMPGVIDPHVHLRDPGATYKEDFRTGTAAAAKGGVTLVFDMPNNNPPTKDVEALRMKMKEAREKALVDYSFYGMLTGDNGPELRPLVQGGVIGFKCYMAETTGSPPPPSDQQLLTELAIVAKSGRRVSFHAEDDALIKSRLSGLRHAGRTDAIAHYESRPELAESNAVRRAIRLGAESGCDVHIAHLSSAAGAQDVRAGKRQGRRVTAETCPQYLLLDKDDYKSKGALMKVNPSIKRSEDRDALWRALTDGTIDMLATDHAPHALKEKVSGESIFDKPSGFPGLETAVALMLTCVNRRLLSLSRYVQLTSSGPAKAWGLYPKKGSIEVGSDADLTIVDPKRRWKIDPEEFVSKAKYSPFDGFEATGAPAYTIVRGHVVMDQGHIDDRSRGEVQSPL